MLTLIRDNVRHFVSEVRQELPRAWCFVAHSPYHVDEGLSWWCKKCHAKGGIGD